MHKSTITYYRTGTVNDKEFNETNVCGTDDK